MRTREGSHQGAEAGLPMGCPSQPIGPGVVT
jgi:hypothetical protein